MSVRNLPARPDLDHLKHEARALRKAFDAGDSAVRDRVRSVLGERSELKLTDAQRVLAREYGFATWAKLRAHVLAARSLDAAVNTFLATLESQDRSALQAVLRAEPRIASTSLHVAAALGDITVVRRLIAADASHVRARAGTWPAEPLLWLCFSPFHGESSERDEALHHCARALLEAGADPNTTDARYHVSALYGVTGMHNVPRIARLLLDAGANPTDGESIFHAAEKYHIEAMELLYSYGVQLNAAGDWGNTPLYFLLRYWDVASMPHVQRGIQWLLDHGADPNVRCAQEKETSLHVAVRVGQHADVVKQLIERGADVHARRGDGRSAWALARRGGFDELLALLERHGARPEPVSAADELLAACGRGDIGQARASTSPALLASLDDSDLRLLPDAAARNRTSVARAAIAANFPVNTTGEMGATALHHAAMHGNVLVVRELLERQPDLTIRDAEHHSTAMGWACFGADHVQAPGGDYPATVRALLAAGAQLHDDEYVSSHDGVREVLRLYTQT